MLQALPSKFQLTSILNLYNNIWLDRSDTMPQVKGYTFGMRLRDNIPKPSTTPSPLDYSTSCVTRFGKLSSPAYTIKCKATPQSRGNSVTTPGPLDYQNLKTMKLKSTKSYSFGFGERTVFRVRNDTPPPNTYTVPSTIGNNVPDKKKTGRSFSMPGRRKDFLEKSTTPGPGAYEAVNVNLYKKKQPEVPFTGHERAPFVPVDPQIPGPSHYNTLNCNIDKIKGRSAPKAPFGIRHSPKKFTVFTKADIMF